MATKRYRMDLDQQEKTIVLNKLLCRRSGQVEEGGGRTGRGWSGPRHNPQVIDRGQPGLGG